MQATSERMTALTLQALLEEGALASLDAQTAINRADFGLTPPAFTAPQSIATSVADFRCPGLMSPN